MIGDSLVEVKFLEKRPASTRRRKRVGTAAPSLSAPRKAASLSGTVTYIFFFVERPLLTKTAGLPSRLKTTLFLPLPALKPLPLIVSLSPMATFSGVTVLITG